MHQTIGYTLIIMSTLINTHAITRDPYAAGSFYPSNQQELIQAISSLNAQAKLPLQDHSQPKILILPHAGYRYSGLGAIRGYATIKDQSIDTFILIGPYHKENFPGVSIWTNDEWTTPLGIIGIESSLAKAIQKKNSTLNYRFEIHKDEHSLEVQVPFIQYFFPQATIVPILISNIEYSKLLADAIYDELVKIKKSIAIIISTDMSHYHSQQQANQIDQETIQILKNNNASLFQDSIIQHKSQLCGAAAVQTGLELAQKFKNRNFRLYDYRTSGDSTGDTRSVVGYFAAGFVADQKSPDFIDESYTKKEQNVLLRIARKTLTHYIKTGQKPIFEYQDPFLKKEKAVFITLWKGNKELRGCIGRTTAQEPLLDAIVNMTIAAASKDSRFKPVTLDELDSIALEISILGTSRTIFSVDEIIFKKHGVIVSKNDHQGVFLPQVADNFLTKEDFLSELCIQKANLPHECWKDKNTKIEIFTTEIIREN